MQRTAWLFTKEQQSVRLELRSKPDGVQLVIDGPGPASSTHEFPPGTSVDGFREDYERKLIADGYKLQIVSERRGGAPRSSGPERRR